MRNFVFSSIVLVSILFSGCIQNTVRAVKRLDYSFPETYADDKDLNIGLFSPFESPLVQEREYEFTATTPHRFVKVHFVIPEKGDKWISLRKLESNIFTQNLTIPEGTERVEIGISDRAHANGGTDFKAYASYDVISLDKFKDFILDEESRREHDEVSSNSQEAEFERNKVVIDHKYTAKYPKKLKRGETYRFKIGPFDSSYCIFNTVNKDKFSWMPVERNKEKYFELSYQVPSDADEFRIALSSTSTTFIESLVSFKLDGKIEENNGNRLDDGEKIEISTATMSDLSIPVDDGKLYTLSVDSFGSDYKFCQVYCNNDNWENLDFCVLDRVNDRYETNCLYVPNGTTNINIYLSDDYFSGINRIASIKVDDIKTETQPMKAGKDIRKSDNYRTEEPDLELIEYLEGRNARSVGKTNPDALADLCVDYIKKNAVDDFHKIKLVHDTIWYLASYDWDSLNAGDYKPWDYRTVLSRGLCVCAGYSRTFVYFCDRLGIRAINVLGSALLDEVRTTDDIENQNPHAWTMVELDGGWYLFDLTWDCSNTQNGIRDNLYSCKYFFVNPEEFIMQHFPQNREKQLLDPPFTSSELLRLIKG